MSFAQFETAHALLLETDWATRGAPSIVSKTTDNSGEFRLAPFKLTTARILLLAYGHVKKNAQLKRLIWAVKNAWDRMRFGSQL